MVDDPVKMPPKITDEDLNLPPRDKPAPAPPQKPEDQDIIIVVKRQGLGTSRFLEWMSRGLSHASNFFAKIGEYAGKFADYGKEKLGFKSETLEKLRKHPKAGRATLRAFKQGS